MNHCLEQRTGTSGAIPRPADSPQTIPGKAATARAYRLYDAHNHLQDARLKEKRREILETLEHERVARMVVNGSSESDWAGVLELATDCPRVLPSFGYHPWYVRERTASWLQHLEDYLDRVPSAIGEIGLDRWIKDPDLAGQEEVFLAQLRLAAERNLPVSIHCLRAWGWLMDLLRRERRPACGFLLHSYGGPLEMVKPLAELGAYFSFPGYYLRPGKERQRETFRHVPHDRFLVETDAPDQSLPADLVRYPLPNDESRSVNHPANLGVVYEKLAEWLSEPMEAFAQRIEANFLRLFAPVLGTGSTAAAAVSS
jgi:TatD DNase family protein